MRAERAGDDAVHQGGSARVVGVTQGALGLSAHVVDRPGGPVLGDGGDHGGGLLIDPLTGDVDLLGHDLMGDVGDHRRQSALAAEHFDGLHTPGVALLGQRAWFVLGLACFQGGLLGQREHLDHGGFTAVGGVELLGQLAHAVVDGRAARGVFFDQLSEHAHEFTHRPFAGFGGGFSEAHAELGYE